MHITKISIHRPVTVSMFVVAVVLFGLVSLDRLAEELQGVGNVTQNRFLLRFTVDKYTITVFPDGRAIIGGTDNIAEARTVYARYIGN